MQLRDGSNVIMKILRVFSKKKKKSGRRRILGEEHKQFILRCIDENPFVVLTEVVGGLMQNFVDLNVLVVLLITS